MIFKKLKIKTKLLLPLTIFLLIFLVLTTSLISNQYTKSKSLKELEQGIELATFISKTLYVIQKERAITSGFILNPKGDFKNLLFLARENTNKEVKKIKLFSQTLKNKQINNSLNEAFFDLDKLDVIRNKIDLASINVRDSIDFYAEMNDKFLNVIIEISKISKLPDITQKIIAYSNFMYLIENSAMERTVGIAIISQCNFDGKLRVLFTDLIAIQNLYTKKFFKYVSTDSKIFYEQNYKGRELKNIKIMREVILNSRLNQDFGINPQYLFQTIDIKINKLNLIGTYLEDEIIFNIQSELNATYTLFGTFTALNITIISIFIIMIILVIFLIKDQERLKSLTEKYIISSTTDLEGNLTDVSEAFCKISQLSKKELIGKPHNIIRHPDMQKETFKSLWNSIKQGQLWQGKIKNRKKDGGYYWVYANLEPLFDIYGKVEGYAAIRLDITDNIDLQQELKISKEKDKQLLAQSRMAQMGEMISMIAHQWRQPLGSITAICINLKLQTELKIFNLEKKEDLVKYVSQVEKSLDNINELVQGLSITIDDFRNFYKPNKKFVNIEIEKVIEKALNIIKPSMISENIRLIETYDYNRTLDIYSNEMMQVIINILKNAYDNFKENKIKSPYIKIRTYEEENFPIIEIIDNGGGVPKDIINEIFDPYFSTKDEKNGTGLGLYMSKIIVEKHHNGVLSLKNTDDGVCFKIKLGKIKSTL